MSQNYFFAHVANRASRIIAEHHLHLADVPIVFRFFAEEKKSNGRQVLGQASKLNPKERHAYGSLISETEGTPTWCFNPEVSGGCLIEGFAIDLYYKAWKDWESKGMEKYCDALLDHELCHCLVEINDDDEPVLSMASHDIEEFYAVIERHGDWKGEVDRIEKAKAKSQLSLFEPKAATG